MWRYQSPGGFITPGTTFITRRTPYTYTEFYCFANQRG